jgi:hypothetical protein
MAGMALLSRKPAEERAAEKEQERKDDHYRRWYYGPVGQAKVAHHRGDTVYQVPLVLGQQVGVVIAMVGTENRSTSTNVNDVLNAIAAEGWDLLTVSVVYVTTGEVSRDRFLASGQQVAISGMQVGYYVWRRREKSAAEGDLDVPAAVDTDDVADQQLQ